MIIAIIAVIIIGINSVLPQPVLLEVVVRPTRAFGTGRAAGCGLGRGCGLGFEGEATADLSPEIGRIGGAGEVAVAYSDGIALP
jgi:hypothetical protein